MVQRQQLLCSCSDANPKTAAAAAATDATDATDATSTSAAADDNQ